MVVWLSRFYNYSAELRQHTWRYPVYTLQSTPTDTYSHFNFELLLIWFIFSVIRICSPIFAVVLTPSCLLSQSFGVG